MNIAIPCFIINNHDYASYISQLTPTLNDLDADGSGRNLLDGKMHRTRIATKRAWTADIIRMSASKMSQFIDDLYEDENYVSITTLDPQKNKRVTKEYYTSTVNPGIQRTIDSAVYYDGGSVTITER